MSRMWSGSFCVSPILACPLPLKMISYFRLSPKGEPEKAKPHEFEKFHFALTGFPPGSRSTSIFSPTISENPGFTLFGKKNKEYKANVSIRVCNGNQEVHCTFHMCKVYDPFLRKTDVLPGI